MKIAPLMPGIARFLPAGFICLIGWLQVLGADQVEPGPRKQVEQRWEGKRAESREGKRPARPNERGVKAFHEADRDKDGALSFEEFSRMRRLANMDETKRRRIFEFLDKNGDGKLGMRELHPVPQDRIAQIRKHFRRLDQDASGAVSLDEFKRVPFAKQMKPEQAERYFSRLDRDGNGELEMSELPRPQRPVIQFDKHDKDRSGGLDFSEYSSIPFINRLSEERQRKLFGRIDKNGDEILTPREIREAHGLRERGPKGKPPKRQKDKRPPGGARADLLF